MRQRPRTFARCALQHTLGPDPDIAQVERPWSIWGWGVLVRIQVFSAVARSAWLVGRMAARGTPKVQNCQEGSVAEQDPFRQNQHACRFIWFFVDRYALLSAQRFGANWTSQRPSQVQDGSPILDQRAPELRDLRWHSRIRLHASCNSSMQVVSPC